MVLTPSSCWSPALPRTGGAARWCCWCCGCGACGGGEGGFSEHSVRRGRSIDLHVRPSSIHIYLSTSTYLDRHVRLDREHDEVLEHPRPHALLHRLLGLLSFRRTIDQSIKPRNRAHLSIHPALDRSTTIRPTHLLHVPPQPVPHRRRPPRLPALHLRQPLARRPQRAPPVLQNELAPRHGRPQPAHALGGLDGDFWK